MAQKENQGKQDLEQQDFYHGFRPRKDVNIMLKEPGDYLLRATTCSNITTIVLSVKSESKDIKHLTLSSSNGSWQLSVLKEKTKLVPKFKTVVDLVAYYKNHNLPTKTMLKRAIVKPKWMYKHSAVVFHPDIDLIGRGNFCNVYKGHLKEKDSLIKIAVKALHQGQTGDQQGEEIKEARVAMLEEAETMSFYNHEHVIKFFGVVCDHLPVLILMEYCPGDSLEIHLKKTGDAISCGERLLYATEAAKGMRYLHAQKCVHRDLAARNCLISSNGRIKISDFGLSAILKDNESMEVYGGKSQIPLRWMAPESLAKPMRFSTKSDCWAFGVLLFEIFNNGIKPFADEIIWPTKRIATHIRRGIMPDMPTKAPTDVCALCVSIWIIDVEKRPSMHYIYTQLSTIRKKYPLPDPEDMAINRIQGVYRENSVVLQEKTLNNETKSTGSSYYTF